MQHPTVFNHTIPQQPYTNEGTSTVRALLAQVYGSGCDRHPINPLASLAGFLDSSKNDIRRTGGLSIELVQAVEQQVPALHVLLEGHQCPIIITCITLATN